MTHNAAVAASCYADECVVQSPTMGELVGRGAVGKNFQHFFSAFPDLSWQPGDLFLTGEVAVQTGTLSGTDIGGFLAPTGNPFRSAMVFVSTCRDGQITHERRMIDRGGLLMQLSAKTGAQSEVSGLYQELLERTRREHDMRVAAEVQQALAPLTRHAGSGYELASAVTPCRAIGGDFLDYFCHSWCRCCGRARNGSAGTDAPICQDGRSGGFTELLARAEVSHDALIDFPSEKAFTASDDVPFRPSIRPASDDIVDRRLVIAHTDHDGSMEGGVRLSVAAPIEAVSTGGHPRGSGDGTRAAELGKGGCRANPLRVIPEDN